MGKFGRKQTGPAVGKEGTAVGQTPVRVCYTWCDRLSVGCNPEDINTRNKARGNAQGGTFILQNGT